MRRRTLITTLPLLALAGCGYQLRQAPQLPFTRIALVNFDEASPLLRELKRSLPPSVQVEDVPPRAQVILRALIDRRERAVVASTTAGQVREMQLRVRFQFQLDTPGGRELIGPTELLQARDMSYSETFALAKEQEQTQLYAAMQSDIVRQLLRRLAQVQGV